MQIEIATDTTAIGEPVRVGNVYAVKGGRGLARGHMNVIIAMTEAAPYAGVRVLMLTIDKEGKPQNVTQYALHYVEDLQPIAFVDGLENLNLVMRSL